MQPQLLLILLIVWTDPGEDEREAGLAAGQKAEGRRQR